MVLDFYAWENHEELIPRSNSTHAESIASELITTAILPTIGSKFPESSQNRPYLSLDLKSLAPSGVRHQQK